MKTLNEQLCIAQTEVKKKDLEIEELKSRIGNIKSIKNIKNIKKSQRTEKASEGRFGLGKEEIIDNRMVIRAESEESETESENSPIQRPITRGKGKIGKGPKRSTAAKKGLGLGATDRAHNTLHNDQNCLACNHASRDIAFLPCRHVLYCNNCAINLQNKFAPNKPKCPVCQKNITKFTSLMFP